MRNAPLLVTGLLVFSLAGHVLAHGDHAHHRTHSHEPSHDHGHDHNHGSDSLGAHQHGVAQLNVVLDSGNVEIELDSPADNLVGFEYIPTREDDLEKVRSVRQRMQDPDNLFRFPVAAGCNLQEVELKSPLFDALNGEPASQERGHGHDDDHDHQHEQATHNDIEAHYSFECSNPGALSQIEVTLFNQFPGTERLVLQAIGDAGQQGGELTPAQNLIRF